MLAHLAEPPAEEMEEEAAEPPYVRGGWAADEPAAGGGAAQIVRGRKKLARGVPDLVALQQFFPKFEGPERLTRVDLNLLRTFSNQKA